VSDTSVRVFIVKRLQSGVRHMLWAGLICLTGFWEMLMILES
jgi:hypothetical protein